jgi:hypothetical protein
MPRKWSADIVALNFRLPKKLHRRLELEAKRKTTSINALVVSTLEASFERPSWMDKRVDGNAMVSAIERLESLELETKRQNEVLSRIEGFLKPPGPIGPEDVVQILTGSATNQPAQDQQRAEKQGKAG